MIKSGGWRNSLLSEVVRSTFSWAKRTDCTRRFPRRFHSSTAQLDKRVSLLSPVPGDPRTLAPAFLAPINHLFSDPNSDPCRSFSSESANLSDISNNALGRCPLPHTHAGKKVLWRELCIQNT